VHPNYLKTIHKADGYEYTFWKQGCPIGQFILWRQFPRRAHHWRYSRSSIYPPRL
jgi:hypothetical protein